MAGKQHKEDRRLHWLMIAVGGALGAMARYGVAQAFAVDGKFRYATLAVNVVGCFMIGILFVIVDDRGILSASARLFLMTGFLGAFTTFSNFSLDTLSLWQNNQPGLAIAYVFFNMQCCLAAVFVAVHIAQTL